MDTSNPAPHTPDARPCDVAELSEQDGSRERLVAAARRSGASPPVLEALAAIPEGGRHPLLEQLWARGPETAEER
jgi:hypothetical protein